MPCALQVPFYWNPTTALCQWEHPQESFVSGLARRFLRAREEEKARLRLMTAVAIPGSS